SFPNFPSPARPLWLARGSWDKLARSVESRRLRVGRRHFVGWSSPPGPCRAIPARRDSVVSEPQVSTAAAIDAMPGPLGASATSAVHHSTRSPAGREVGMAESNHRIKSILLFGMPGSGKGTQGAILNGLPSLIHVSMGDIFRKIPRGGKFGREIEQYTSQGLMVPDDLTVRIFQRHLMIMEMQEMLMPEVHSLVLDGLP